MMMTIILIGNEWKAAHNGQPAFLRHCFAPNLSHYILWVDYDYDDKDDDIDDDHNEFHYDDDGDDLARIPSALFCAWPVSLYTLDL